jgi:hypothetical protein
MPRLSDDDGIPQEKVGQSPRRNLASLVIAPSVAKPSALRSFESDLGLPLHVIRFWAVSRTSPNFDARARGRVQRVMTPLPDHPGRRGTLLRIAGDPIYTGLFSERGESGRS